MTTLEKRIIELNREELQSIVQRAQAQPLEEKDCAKLEALIESYAYLTQLLEDKRTSLQRLRKLLFGSGTEKTRAVLKEPPDADAGQMGSSVSDQADDAAAPAEDREEPAGPRVGHGRHSADDYAGAPKIAIAHGSLRPGDVCPDCRHGKVYEVTPPGVLVRFTGQAPLQAKVYQLQKLRCNLCGKVFTAEPPGTPTETGGEKYDAAAASMIALLKYGSGVPFHRLGGLQTSLGIPLPASTQWDIVHLAAKRIAAVYHELIRQAAQGQVLYNDDTTIKILQLMGQRAKQAALQEGGGADAEKKNKSQRTGLFTSGIVSTQEGRRIALFFSGRQHAGENLADVLAHRAKEMTPPIQMCDALARNLPAALKTIVANCLAHGRRRFVEVAERFPEQCRYVLESLGEVYRHDATAREQKMTPEARLRFHQAESGPIMQRLRAWCRRQFDQRLVEANGALGQAISYLLDHWEKLTLFLRQPGAPLDNNLCEQILKRAIVHRKNALFYKTLNGAHVGDLFMSLIHTCRFNNVNPFDYLTELQRHAADLIREPQRWMPWNYPRNAREMIAAN